MLIFPILLLVLTLLLFWERHRDGGCLPLLCSIFIIIIGSVSVLFGGG